MADTGAVDLNAVANGILVVIVGLLSWLGINRGRKAKEEDDTPGGGRQVEIAGAVIDGQKADQIVEAVDRNTHALKEAGRLFGDVRDELREVRGDIRALITEIVRGRR